MAVNKKHLIIFSGAGMSAESGIKTFRDHDGLWENHKISEVATPRAWKNNKELVLRFYNMRIKQLLQTKPNKAHQLVAQLEKQYAVTVITQNVDDLHERAGSSTVIHLHGELKKVQSERHPDLIYPLEKEEIEIGDLCEKGFQLRPNVVWFGEEVPLMAKANQLAETADVFVVIGTSLNVYPAAGIIDYVPKNARCFLIDPNIPPYDLPVNWSIINTKAQEGMSIVINALNGN